MFKVCLQDSSGVRKLKTLTKDTKDGIYKAFLFSGTDLQKEGRRLITSPPKTGRWYGNHRASAAGEAPANRTGNLKQSVSFQTHGFNSLDFGAKARYARWLELGNTKIKARPYLVRSIKDRQKYTQEYFYREIKKALSC